MKYFQGSFPIGDLESVSKFAWAGTFDMFKHIVTQEKFGNISGFGPVKDEYKFPAQYLDVAFCDLIRACANEELANIGKRRLAFQEVSKE